MKDDNFLYHFFKENKDENSYRNVTKLTHFIQDNQKSLNSMTLNDFWDFIVMMKGKNYSLVPFKDKFFNAFDSKLHLIYQNYRPFKVDFLTICNQLAIEDSECVKNGDLKKIFNQFLTINEQNSPNAFSRIIVGFESDITINCHLLKIIAQFYGIDSKVEENYNLWHISAFYNSVNFAQWLKDEKLPYTDNNGKFAMDLILEDKIFLPSTKKKIVSFFYDIEKNTFSNWVDINLKRMDKFIKEKNYHNIELFFNEGHDFSYPHSDYYLDKMIELQNNTQYNFEKELYSNILNIISEKQAVYFEKNVLKEDNKKITRLKL
jgi:hypothetical protein